jgi:hypothetical protein
VELKRVGGVTILGRRRGFHWHRRDQRKEPRKSDASDEFRADGHGQLLLKLLPPQISQKLALMDEVPLRDGYQRARSRLWR